MWREMRREIHQHRRVLWVAAAVMVFAAAAGQIGAAARMPDLVYAGAAAPLIGGVTGAVWMLADTARRMGRDMAARRAA